ncbi:MAG: hypothetical protein ACLGG9_10500 [Thermoleophilia bacterium]
MSADGLVDRLEMLAVARWLDAGRPQDGRIDLPLEEVTLDLDLTDGREGLLDLMAALGELESRGLITVAWPQGVGAGEAELTLSDELRRDARRLFGG